MLTVVHGNYISVNVDGEKFSKMRRTVGCARLPHLTPPRPAPTASDCHGDKTRSIAGRWRPLANQFTFYKLSNYYGYSRNELRNRDNKIM